MSARTLCTALAALAACAAPPGAAPPTSDPSDTDAPDTDAVPPAPSSRVHRLTRAHLDRAMQDLLDVDAEVRLWLPDDPQTGGFDNGESGLYVTPTMLVGLDAAIRRAVDRSVTPPPPWNWTAGQLAAVCADTPSCVVDEEVQQEGGGLAQARLSGPSFEIPFHMPTAGGVHVEIPIASFVVLPSVSLDSATVVLDVGETTALPSEAAFLFDVPHVEAGNHILHFEGLGFTPRGLQITPTAPWKNPDWSARFPCAPTWEAGDEAWAACATQILTPWLERAWRRPPTESELYVLVRLTRRAREEGVAFPAAFSRSLHAALLSPSFLFRLEHLTDGPLDGWAIASRLSFLVWSGLPDEALLADARAGRLATPDGRVEALRRMLADPRRAGFVSDFAGQWLGQRKLDTLQPDVELYPDFDEPLREAMRGEVEAMFDELLVGTRTLSELVDSRTGFVPAPLHLHYGLDAPGPHTELDTVGRGGLLRSAGWLATTSRATRTSLVQRGLGVLRGLLCASTGEPPAGAVQTLTEADPASDVARRASVPSCAQCHDHIDPLGVALEPFGVLGEVRNRYPGGAALPPSTVLADGTVIHGPDDLARWVASDPRLAACFARQVLSWTWGRSPDPDAPEVARALAALEESGGALPALLERIVQDEAFARPFPEAP